MPTPTSTPTLTPTLTLTHATAPETGSILGIGASCFVSVYDAHTVLKGHQIWVGRKRRSCKSRPCEEALHWEALVYKRLGKHPHILNCHGLVQVHQGVSSLRLELAPLGNVRQYIEGHEPPPEQTRLRMALDVAIGLAHIHSCEVQHADLSCRNLFLFNEFRVKIGDFGASVMQACPFTPTVCEEIRYELPCRGRTFNSRPAAKRELFALGSAIYEILAWAKPFPDWQDEEVEQHYARDEFPCLDSIAIGSIINDCWMEVYETADEVVASLHHALSPNVMPN